MSLTTRADGQTIHSVWFNDFKDLLTGVMADQPVTVKQNISVQALGPKPVALSAATAAGSALGIGTYQYVYTYASATGESLPSPITSVTTTSLNQAVSLTGITTGPTGTTKRRIYRTTVGGSVFLRVASLNDNSTTTFSDTVADSSLGVAAPMHPTFGGAVNFLDDTGATTFQIGSDGGMVGTLVVTNGITNQGGHIGTTGNISAQAYGSAPGAPSAAINAGGSVDTGAHTYAVTFTSSTGETQAGTGVIATTTGGNNTVALTAIPLGPTGTVGRKVYRSKVGTTNPLFLVTTLNDNTTTSYTDSVADSSLSATQSPGQSTFGGSLMLKDSSGTTQLSLSGEGTVFFNRPTASSSVNYVKFAPSDTGEIFGMNINHADSSFSMFDYTQNKEVWRGTGPKGLKANNLGMFRGPWSQFSGSTTGTFSHGLGVTPTACHVTQHNAGSQTQGWDSETSTQVHITCGAPAPFVAEAVRLQS